MSKSSRQFRRESDRKFLYLVILSLVFVGGILIGLIYGAEALFTALPCLLGGAMVIIVPWLILNGLEKWRAKSEEVYLMDQQKQENNE